MKKYLYLLTCLSSFLILSCSQGSGSGDSGDLAESAGFDMTNTAVPAEGLTTGGQPSKQDLERLAQTGTKVIVNLRTKGEFNKFDEKKVVEDLGMTYVSIEIDGSDGITAENARRLDVALNGLKEPALVHCASSNRVGGLLAYRAFNIQNKSAKESLAFGKSAGMSSTERKVKKLLGL